MPRAMMLFKHIGVEVLPVPADFHVVGVGNLWDLSLVRFLPQGEGLFLSDTTAREYLGISFYWVRGLFVAD